MAKPWELSHRAIGLIDGRWTLAVLAELRDGGRRYQDVHEAIEGATRMGTL
jgi:DNA-binding HxlR family transcriptional regulator